MLEWQNRHEYGEALINKGFKKIGEGFYSEVYARPNARTVIKVGPVSDGWPTYAAWAVKKGYAGNIAPKVKSFDVIKAKGGPSFYVAEIERLLHGGRFPYRLVKDQTAFSPLKDVPPAYRQFVSDIKKLKKRREARRFRFDLHSGNFMMRSNGALVVTDPFSGRNGKSAERAKRSLAQTLKRKRSNARRNP